MNRFLLIIILIIISGCASNLDFQGQSQKTFSGSEFKFRSGISGNVPPGLCQIKQLQSETKDYGVVFFSNCNPHTNNRSLVTWIHFFEFQSMVGFLVLEWDLCQGKDLLFQWIYVGEL